MMPDIQATIPSTGKEGAYNENHLSNTWFRFLIIGILGFIKFDLPGMHLSSVYSIIQNITGIVAFGFCLVTSLNAARTFALIFDAVYFSWAFWVLSLQMLFRLSSKHITFAVRRRRWLLITDSFVVRRYLFH
jgi:hypothetical protein